MSCFFSKDSNNPPSDSNLVINPDHLTSYQNACQLEPDLESFDSTQQDRTTRVVKYVQLRSLSLDSLRQEIRNLHEMNQDVVNFILECQHDISKNRQLSSLVKDFLNLSILTIDFCILLENCLKNARNSSSFLRNGIHQFGRDNDYVKTLEHFKGLKALEAPFLEEFFEKFESVRSRQQSMVEKLGKETGKVAKKLKSAKVLKKMTNVIFVATFSVVLICTVVTSAVSAPPVVVALAAAAVVPLGSMGKWVDSLWKEYESELKWQMKLMRSIKSGNDVVIKDLKNIKALVDKFGNEKKDLVQKAEFAINEEEEEAAVEAVAAVVDEMRRIMNDFEKTIDDLSYDSVRTREDIVRAREMIVRRIVEAN